MITLAWSSPVTGRNASMCSVFGTRILHVRGEPVDFAWCAPLLGD
jgi:hypothetical protein